MPPTPSRLKSNTPAMTLKALAELVGVDADYLASIRLPVKEGGVDGPTVRLLAGAPVVQKGRKGGAHIYTWPDCLRYAVIGIAGPAIRPRWREYVWQKLLTNPLMVLYQELERNPALVAAAGSSCGFVRGERKDLLYDIDQVEKGGLRWLIIPPEDRAPRMDIKADPLALNIDLVAVGRALEERLLQKVEEPGFIGRVSWSGGGEVL